MWVGYLKKFQFTYLYYNVITRYYRKSHSESFTMIFVVVVISNLNMFIKK